MTTYQKATLLKSLQKLDHEMRTRHYPAVIEVEQPRGYADRAEPTDAEEHFLEQMCPSDATFR